MDDNLYAPPQAAVADPPAPVSAREFFVVAPRKLLLMYVATLGLYAYYWWYQHWARYRRFNREPLWPVARAIFPVFFAHRLTGEIDDRLSRLRLSRGWSPGLLATAFVLLQIFSSVADRFSWYDVLSPWSDVAGLALLLPIGLLLMRIQRAANRAAGDADAQANGRLTWANWAWLVPFGLLWLLLLVGMYDMLSGIAGMTDAAPTQ